MGFSPILFNFCTYALYKQVEGREYDLFARMDEMVITETGSLKGDSILFPA